LEPDTSESRTKLSVLLYHSIGPALGGTHPDLTVPPKRFERQMRWLANHGYTGIRPSDWLERCCEGKPLPEKSILITFDDGYSDVGEYALPVLRNHGFAATVYVVTGEIGGTNSWDLHNGAARHRLMTAAEIQKWAADGIEFGVHGRTHARLPALSQAALHFEVCQSADELASLLGSRPISFAYPYGDVNEVVRKCVCSAFDVAFSMEDGLNYPQTNLYMLRRTMVQPTDSMLNFASRVRFGRSIKGRIKSFVRHKFATSAMINRASDFTSG
jgi:peptidoglycan/xylan/chitin deacetylase (PgdA/CDA1 family)